jgi:hypothetical protein
MSTPYNLDEQAAESFPFILGGNNYEMRYPTTEELQNVPTQVDTSAMSDAEKIAANRAYNDKMNEYFYEFISPVGEAPSIEDALKVANVLTLRHFAAMMKTELSLEG